MVHMLLTSPEVHSKYIHVSSQLLSFELISRQGDSIILMTATLPAREALSSKFLPARFSKMEMLSCL